MADIDWASWSKTRPFTIDALSIFNAIDVDPFTALIGGAICQPFKFSPNGDHNLSNVFGALKGIQGHPTIALGYTSRHVVQLLLKSDEGSDFLAVCGALCEYYPLATVTACFMVLARKSEVPPDMRPAESQWSRLVRACAGVLATSTFGTVIAKYAEACEATVSTSPADIIEWLLALNARSTTTISGDGPFIAAVSDWLFGIDFAIQTETKPTGASEVEPKLTINSTTSNIPTAGRVHWDLVFRTCFGQAWRELDKEALTAIIAAASGMTHNALIHSGRDPRNFFLRHEVGISSFAGHGVNETILAWFEELRRIAGGISRFYKGHHTPQEMHSGFDERLQALELSCKCSSCGDGSVLFCKVTLSLVVVGLGLYVARMVVVPNLYLKVGGIQMFYHQLHEDRLKRQEMHVRYSEWFIKDITTDLPTPLKMLEIAIVLFTGTHPAYMPENCVSLNRDGLYFMITYLKFDPNAAAESRPDASVQVHNGDFSYNGRFLNGNFWNNGVANISLPEGFNNIRTKPKEVRQIVKLHDQTTLISQIPRNPDWEAKAEQQDWDVMG